MEQTMPKENGQFGTHYHNRIFVGRLPGHANARELAEFFSVFGTIREVKILLDEHGRSRRFGFVTYASRTVAESVLVKRSLLFKGKRILLGPGIKRCLHPLNDKVEVYNPNSSQFFPRSTLPPQQFLPSPSPVTIRCVHKPVQIGPCVPGSVYHTRVVTPNQTILGHQRHRLSSIGSDHLSDCGSPPVSPVPLSCNLYYYFNSSSSDNYQAPRIFTFDPPSTHRSMFYM